MPCTSSSWYFTNWLYFPCQRHVGWRFNDPSPDCSGEAEGRWSVDRSASNVRATRVWECHWLAERLAYLGRYLTRDAVWRRKASRIFPRLQSDPKAEGRRQPMGEALFVRECRAAIRNLSGSSDLSRPQKKLYRELVVGSASDSLSERRGWTAEEIRSHWNWAPGSSIFNNSEFSLIWRLARNALPLLCSLRQWFRRNGWARLRLLRASSPVLGSRRGADGSHRTQAARAPRRWLRRRQRSSSVLGWEACGVSRDSSCSSNGDLDDAKEGIVWWGKLFSSWSGFVF